MCVEAMLKCPGTSFSSPISNIVHVGTTVIHGVKVLVEGDRPIPAEAVVRLSKASHSESCMRCYGDMQKRRQPTPAGTQ